MQHTSVCEETVECSSSRQIETILETILFSCTVPLLLDDLKGL